MPRVRLLLLFIIISFRLKGQYALPPGVVKVDSILIDEIEVTNLNWLEYLHYLKQDSSYLVYKAALPDTMVWEQVYDNDLAWVFTTSYLRNPAFRYFPLIGVTYDQATDYCHWRSLVVTQKMKLEDQSPFRINYRLPTPAEWMAVAQKSGSYLPLNDLENLNRMKFQRSNLADIKKRSGSGYSLEKLRRSIISFYQRNPILLIENLDTKEDYEYKPYLGVGYGPKKSMKASLVNDLRGNVSEMTTEKGVALGGNWTTTLNETPIYVRFKYSEPSPVVGFRCLCEIKE